MRIIVTRDGAPLSGEAVTWATSAANGFFEPPVTQTAGDGTASAFWTLGTVLGIQAGTVTVAGATPLALSATATAGPGGGLVDILVTSNGGARFDPIQVVIAPNTTVRWTWDTGSHSITPSGNPIFTGIGVSSPPLTHAVTFVTPGTYRYHCIVHGTPDAGMRGTVVVQ